MFLKTVTRIMRGLLFDEECFVCKKSGSLLHSGCCNYLEPSPPIPHPWITSLWSYRNPIMRKIIAYIKKYRSKELIETLVTAHLKTASTGAYDLVIPIPPSHDRMKQYGFNQAHEIAVCLAENLHVPCLGLLASTGRNKRKQALISKRVERLKNRKGSYRLKNSACQKSLRGKRILLADDISTTGATLREARDILMLAGARHVDALVLAH